MKARLVASIALTLLLASCSREAWQRKPALDDVMAAVPWFKTMRNGVSIQPYEAIMALPVDGTVPITGSEPPMPITADPARVAAINALRNPVAPSAESIARGEDRFAIFCSPCHGFGGDGDGTVDQAMFGIVPSLKTDQARAHSDGMLYTIIRHGRGAMSAYGDRLRPEDRWNVVNYVRQLQSGAGQ